MGYFLKNSDGEYIKTIDTADETLEFTKDPDEALDYTHRRGGGQWSAEMDKEFINFHFKDELKKRVTTLRVVYEE